MDRFQALQTFFGYASFRDGQEELIAHLEAGEDVLGILPTGGGKSLCYQIPAILAPGITVVISPLISLMADQVHALNEAGVPAAFLNSSLSPTQYRTALSRAANGAYKIIYVAPERLLTDSFLSLCRRVPVGLVAVDEAHCVSQWGQDFRPGYLKIPQFLEALPHRPPVGAFTATATPRVRQDIVRDLALQNPYCKTTGFDRENLYFAVEHPQHKKEALLRFLQEHPNKSGIIYCSTRKTVEEVCDLLRSEGIAATRYHAGLPEEERRLNQEEFLFDRSPVMAATNAFGMGIDKSNVSFVLHYNMPASIEAYYQEAGRAGRDGSPAECVLFFHEMDVRTHHWLLTHSDPNPALTPQQQQQTLQGQLARLETMAEYCRTSQCLRRYILHYFGETAAKPCGRCGNCLEAERHTTTGLPAKKAASFSPEDEALFERLKALRAKLAKQTRHPAFTIFTDATLRDLVRRKPQTPEEFLSVSGVGEKKQKQYGKQFLAAINPPKAAKVTKAPKTKAADSPSKPRTGAKPSEPHPSAKTGGRRWSPEEETLLLRELQCGVTVEQARLIHCCTAEEVEAHRKHALTLDSPGELGK